MKIKIHYIEPTTEYKKLINDVSVPDEDFYIEIEILLRIEGRKNDDKFRCIVLTPENLQKASVSKYKFVPGYSKFFTNKRPWVEIEKRLRQLIINSERNTWLTTAIQISRHFKWDNELNHNIEDFYEITEKVQN